MHPFFCFAFVFSHSISLLFVFVQLELKRFEMRAIFINVPNMTEVIFIDIRHINKKLNKFKHFRYLSKFVVVVVTHLL